MSTQATVEQQRRILVVDDDQRIRRTIQLVLQDEGFIVEVAADGLQAIERAARHLPQLVVLDMMLPIMDGAAVADRLRADYVPPPPILLITAGGHAREQAQRMGAYAHLTKPFDLEALITAVRLGLPTS